MFRSSRPPMRDLFGSDLTVKYDFVLRRICRVFRSAERGRKPHHISVSCDETGLPRLLHWLDCEFGEKNALSYYEYGRF